MSTSTGQGDGPPVPVDFQGPPFSGDGRHRDIFPLPHFNVPVPADGVSRAVARRRHRKVHALEWANEAIDSLNHMSGCSHLCAAPSLSECQRAVLSRLRDSYCRLPPPLLRMHFLREPLASS